MNHEVFQSGWQEQAFFPDQCKCQVLFLLVLSDCSLPSFGSLFSHSCADHSSVEDSGLGGGGAAFRALGFPLRSTLSVTLCYKLQWPWSPQSPPGPGVVPTSWDEAYKLSQESKLGKYWGLSSFVICLSGIRIFCCQIASLLKTIVSHASFVFYCQVGMYARTGSFSRPELLKSCTLPEKDYFQKWPLTHSWEPSWECSDQSTFICLRSWAMLH